MINEDAMEMTEEQKEAYNYFFDYMVKLYYEFGYLLDEIESQNSNCEEKPV